MKCVLFAIGLFASVPAFAQSEAEVRARLDTLIARMELQQERQQLAQARESAARDRQEAAEALETQRRASENDLEHQKMMDIIMEPAPGEER